MENVFNLGCFGRVVVSLAAFDDGTSYSLGYSGLGNTVAIFAAEEVVIALVVIYSVLVFGMNWEGFGRDTDRQPNSLCIDEGSRDKHD
jgi:hypothetical protein